MDAELLGRLLDEHADALQLYARQWCDSPDDVVQEAFIRLVQQHPPPHQPVGWLYRAVRNGAISASRSDGRRRRRECAAAEARGWFVEADDSSLETIAAAEALARLPIEQREIIVAHLWGGLTFEQIAAVSDVSSSTAHRRYEAGLSALRERLGFTWPAKTSIQN